MAFELNFCHPDTQYYRALIFIRRLKNNIGFVEIVTFLSKLVKQTCTTLSVRQLAVFLSHGV